MSNLSTAFAIQAACTDSVMEDENMIYAAEIAKQTDFNPEILQLLMKYSASLSASVATRVTHILMTESEMSSMMNDLMELESLNEN
jgi:predicted hydrolase (HD superfamily)